MPVIQSEIDVHGEAFAQNREAMLAAIATFRDVEQKVLDKAQEAKAKFDKRGAEDALRDIRKQWKRNRTAFKTADEDVPVYPTIASQFNDPGVSWMFANLCRLLREKIGAGSAGHCSFEPNLDTSLKEPRATVLIPGSRVRYLAEIAEQGRAINHRVGTQAEIADRFGAQVLVLSADVRRIAAELDLRPTKQWGQNFVIDPNTIRRIVQAADVTADEHVLEIGPGLGSLTLGLLDAAAAVTAVEIDPVTAARLPRTAAEIGRAHV